MAEVTLTINGRSYTVACDDGQEAHEFVRKASMEADESGLKEVLLKKKKITDAFTKKELDNMFKPENYIGDSKKIAAGAVKKAQGYL